MTTPVSAQSWFSTDCLPADVKPRSDTLGRLGRRYRVPTGLAPAPAPSGRAGAASQCLRNSRAREAAAVDTAAHRLPRPARRPSSRCPMGPVVQRRGACLRASLSAHASRATTTTSPDAHRGRSQGRIPLTPGRTILLITQNGTCPSGWGASLVLARGSEDSEGSEGSPAETRSDRSYRRWGALGGCCCMRWLS
jgi:hypothetical protein